MLLSLSHYVDTIGNFGDRSFVRRSKQKSFDQPYFNELLYFMPIKLVWLVGAELNEIVNNFYKVVCSN